MIRIKELPDDFDERLDLNQLRPTRKSPEDVVEEAVEHHRSGRAVNGDNTFEETLKNFSSTPLFMNNLDVTDAAGMSPADRTTIQG